MKKLVKVLNKYFKDKTFASIRDNDPDCIDFPFGIAVKCKEGIFLSFSLDTPHGLIFDITRALKDYEDILIDNYPVYHGQKETYLGNDAYKAYAKDLAWTHLRAIIKD